MAAIGQARPAQTSGIRTPLFILGTALALFAFLAMFAFGLIFVGRIQTAGTIRIVVAQKDIDARTPITPDLLTFSSVPNNAVPPKVFLRFNDLSGYFASVTIYQGEPITANIVAANGDLLAGSSPTSYLPIPQGFVAMTLPTGEQQGVAGYIAQGDYIDVLATVNTAQISTNNPRTVTKVVFNNLYVIRVGPQSVIPRQGQPQGVASSITVVLSLCDAQYLDWLATNATLKYVLLSYKDYQSALPAADAQCPSTQAPSLIGPSQVESRWGFAKG